MAEKARPTNRRFFITFGVVLVALHAVVGVFALIAFSLGELQDNPALKRRLLRERIEPVAQVVTSPAELLAISAPRPLSRGPQPVEPVPAVASGGQVVEQVCSACHATGVLGAPKSHDEETWAQLAQESGGVDGLVKTAIEGINQMPPRGGVPTLTDEQIRAAIEVMRKPAPSG